MSHRLRTVARTPTCPEGGALLAFGTGESRPQAGRVLNLSEKGDLKEAAANLYHHIKTLDAEGFDPICVEPIPSTGIGLAISLAVSSEEPPPTETTRPSRRTPTARRTPPGRTRPTPRPRR